MAGSDPVEVLSDHGQEFVRFNRSVLRRVGQKHVGNASETELAVFYPVEWNRRLGVHGMIILVGSTMTCRAVVLEFDEPCPPVIVSEDPRGDVTDWRFLVSP